MDEKILSMDKTFICQNHQWMKKYYSWIKVSWMDDFLIRGDHLWMKSTDKDNGWRTWTEPKTLYPELHLLSWGLRITREVLMITKCVNTDGKFLPYGTYCIIPQWNTILTTALCQRTRANMNINYTPHKPIT